MKSSQDIQQSNEVYSGTNGFSLSEFAFDLTLAEVGRGKAVQATTWKGMCFLRCLFPLAVLSCPGPFPPKHTVLLEYVGILSLFLLQAGTPPSIQYSSVSVRNECLTHRSRPTMSISGRVQNTASKPDFVDNPEILEGFSLVQMSLFQQPGLLVVWQSLEQPAALYGLSCQHHPSLFSLAPCLVLQVCGLEAPVLISFNCQLRHNLESLWHMLKGLSPLLIEEGDTVLRGWHNSLVCGRQASKDLTFILPLL